MQHESTRIHKPEAELIPPFVGKILLGLLVSALVVVAWARLTDQPLVAMAPQSTVVEERLFTFEANMSGAVRVMDEKGVLLADLPPEEGGFISGVGRVIERERMKHRVAQDGPVLLMRHENGRYSLRDPSTGWEADLMGFGLDNARAFARLFAL
ncbi:photosynthetic complex assembly protein PuhC [Primorskyibacter sp. S187A]|uniref:photosynthetic complex assembly protein PuhC n=1 Tax=Primorskyibacter sp. S187A TaxID=3415130 RepID=UPI003C7E6DE3